MLLLFKLVFWFFVWMPIWLVTVLFKKKGTENCMTWALKRWAQEDEGYLVVRWCRSSNHPFKWPHFLYLPKDKHQDLEHFLPSNDSHCKRNFPNPWFEGQEHKGDPDSIIEN